jgi:hypothetical protein
MKTRIVLFFVALSLKAFAQPGVTLIDPANLIKDAEDRTLTMKDGNLKNTPVTSYWQLHASGFQSTMGLGAGGYSFTTIVDGAAPGGGDLGLYAYTLSPGNIPSASLMAPIDLPHNSEITALEACYFDRSGQSPNYSNCDLKFNFLRIIDNSCPPEVLGVISSLPSGNLDPNCPIRCTGITLASNPALLKVNNKDYFYYVVVTSSDTGGGNQMCGNWAAANLGLRGVQIQYLQK